jgi:transcriptional regulator with XRE-family HTH domain
MIHVGGKIRALRAEKQMTLDKLAEKSGLSKGLLSKLENNSDSNPSLETLHSIAAAFDLTTADLLETDIIQAKRIVPDEKPTWVDSIAFALRAEGKVPDEDILQALYVLQARKGSTPNSDFSWLHMYRSLELNFAKSS